MASYNVTMTLSSTSGTSPCGRAGEAHERSAQGVVELETGYRFANCLTDRGLRAHSNISATCASVSRRGWNIGQNWIRGIKL